MQLKQFSPHIYYTECCHETDRPVLGYIVGTQGAVMVDAGNSAAHVREFQEAIKEQGLPMPKACVITHWHWDHTFGMNALACETIASRETSLELKRMQEWEWTDEAMKERLDRGEEIAFADEHIRAEYRDLGGIQVKDADRIMTEDLVIDCGDVTCHCLLTPSAHSEGSVMVWVPEEKALFLGDIYNDDFYQDHSRDIEKTRALYEALEKLAFETAFPGHSEPVARESLMAFLKRFLQ